MAGIFLSTLRDAQGSRNKTFFSGIVYAQQLEYYLHTQVYDFQCSRVGQYRGQPPRRIGARVAAAAVSSQRTKTALRKFLQLCRDPMMKTSKLTNLSGVTPPVVELEEMISKMTMYIETRIVSEILHLCWCFRVGLQAKQLAFLINIPIGCNLVPIAFAYKKNC